jgi:lipoate-protein ligase A
MNLLDLTLDTPAENLALDEALLEEAEASGQPTELLRLWEPRQTMVVIGRASQVNVEVNLAECQRRQIPILRRCSGGAAIVAGSGCLMYSVVLSYDLRPALRMIEQAHRCVLGVVASAVSQIVPGVEHLGSSDLTLGGRKFSGNSLRCKRDHLLYHGTLLYDFPLELIANCLGTPPRQPEYRAGRGHGSFVMNLPADAQALRNQLKQSWNITGETTDWPAEQVQQLVAQRYSQDDWNFRRLRGNTSSQ